MATPIREEIHGHKVMVLDNLIERLVFETVMGVGPIRVQFLRDRIFRCTVF